ncbi:MAG: Ig-like domain-containing protein [Treponema sp.]|jgi:hypothetical protein|nr:Ig-like domain-containing protein [Treponema sp.]
MQINTMQIITHILLLIISIFSFTTCDLLRSEPFEVTSWTPGSGYHAKAENIVVSLTFSLEPDKGSVEKNFSLSGDGDRVKGTFRWNGRKLTFSPLTPLEINTDYAISVSADAHDTEGLSMDEAFNSEFTTRPGNSHSAPQNARPALLAFSPEMYAVVTDPREEIFLYFSLPVPLVTLYENVSISPSMPGFWRLENSGKLAIFTPSEPWTQNTRYEIRFSTSLTDNNGMNIGNDFFSVFTTVVDKEVPYLLNARRITKDGDAFQLTPDKGFVGASELPVENNDWEKEDKLLLVFSKPVDALSVKTYLSVEGASGLVLESEPDFNEEFIFRFDNKPVYESRFIFRLKPGVKDTAGNESKDEYIYRVFANGKYSKPPALTGIRMPLAPENPGETVEPEYFFATTETNFKIFSITEDNYPSGETVNFWIELYFDTAEGAIVDSFSLMELFRIETSNNVLTFSPSRIKTFGFTVVEPHWENYQRIEIAGNITNSTNFGIIYIQIGAGLRDSLENKNENPLRISIQK